MMNIMVSHIFNSLIPMAKRGQNVGVATGLIKARVEIKVLNGFGLYYR